jgi:DNA-binding transcriptional ArsR family regulator
MTIGGLAALADAPQTSISRAVAALEQGGLVRTVQNGRSTRVELVPLSAERLQWCAGQARLLRERRPSITAAEVARMFRLAKGLVFAEHTIAEWLA